MAPFLSGGGYSSEALVFALELARHVPTLRIAQFAEPPSDSFIAGLGEARLRELERIAQRRAPRGARLLAICHSTPDAWVPSRFPGWDEVAPCPPRGAALAVGRTMYESDRLPADWVLRVNRLDEVWVPTAFNVDSFARAGVEPAKLRALAEPVDVDWFDAARHEPLPLAKFLGEGGAELVAQRPFVFLSVFKWEARKGWDVLLRAFLDEFGAARACAPEGDGQSASARAACTHRRVLLVLKTSAFHSTADIARTVREFAASLSSGGDGEGGGGGAAAATAAALALVRVVDRELSADELPRLYAAADAFVLPSRGEGWGRPHAEAMSMSLPTIATNWSGPTAFMHEANSYPVRIERLVPVATDDATIRAEGHLWAEPSVAHLRERMRQVVEDRADAVARGRRAREDMVAHFSPAAVGAAAREMLEALASRAPPRSRDEL